MDSRQRRAVAASPISRRQVLTLGAGVAVLGLTGCAPNANKSQQPAAGSVTFVSDQFQPVDEADEDAQADPGRLQGEGELRQLPGRAVRRPHPRPGPGWQGRHRAARRHPRRLRRLRRRRPAGGPLRPDRRAQGSQLQPDYLELAKLGGGSSMYVPWMQATYIMVASKEAVDLLPSGADVQAITYDQVVAWATAV